MNETRVLSILIQDLEKDQLQLSNVVIHENDEGAKKEMMKQLGNIITLIKGLTAYLLKYIEPPPPPEVKAKPEKVMKASVKKTKESVPQYGIKGLLN